MYREVHMWTYVYIYFAVSYSSYKEVLSKKVLKTSFVLVDAACILNVDILMILSTLASIIV